MAQNAHQSLTDLRFDASYYWRNKVGFTAGAFDTYGSADPLLYLANRTLKPNSAGLNFQIDDTLFGAGGSVLGPRFNTRVGLQYTLYTEFDGAARDYDGDGRSAGANNTLRAFVWAAY